MLGFTWEGGINEEVSVGSPHYIFDTINSDGLFDSVSCLDQLHGWKLIDTDSSLYLGSAILFGDILLEFLCEIVSIV